VSIHRYGLWRTHGLDTRRDRDPGSEDVLIVPRVVVGSVTLQTKEMAQAGNDPVGRLYNTANASIGPFKWSVLAPRRAMAG